MTNLNILDCENFDSMISSLEKIYNSKSTNLISFFHQMDLNLIWENSQKKKKANEYLFDEFNKEFKIDNSKIIKAYWFHNTRVLKNSKFLEGILPTEKAVKRIELLLNDIIQQLDFSINTSNLLNCSTIQKKLKSPVNQGPWAFLIKDFAFERPDGIHDYLNTPELVEDILYYKYPDKYNIILNEFKKRTNKCIVKFRTEREFHPDRLYYVINYIYNKINHKMMDSESNANFSNMGEIIKPEMIIKIDYI